MLYTLKAYINATGKPKAYLLTHDIKRALSDSKSQSGLVHILSSQATTSVVVMEKDELLQQEALTHAEEFFQKASNQSVSRRSFTGPNKYHLMAGLTGLSLTLPFSEGRLLSSPFHEVFALDYEPKPGRREFIISVMGASSGNQQGGGMPFGMG